MMYTCTDAQNQVMYVHIQTVYLHIQTMHAHIQIIYLQFQTMYLHIQEHDVHIGSLGILMDEVPDETGYRFRGDMSTYNNVSVGDKPWLQRSGAQFREMV